jgi:hypothetical protein
MRHLLQAKPKEGGQRGPEAVPDDSIFRVVIWKFLYLWLYEIRSFLCEISSISPIWGNNSTISVGGNIATC